MKKLISFSVFLVLVLVVLIAKTSQAHTHEPLSTKAEQDWVLVR